MEAGGKQRKEPSGKETQLVQFFLGEESFAIRVDQVREIVKYGDITRVPRMPAFIQGVMNLRGRITTVIDLRRRFRIDDGAERTALCRIIVAEMGENQIGIVVDAVKDVIRVPSRSISDPPELMASKVDGRFLVGICRLKDDLVMLVDLDTLLSEEEMLGLKEVEASAGRSTGPRAAAEHETPKKVMQ